ncbi:MAG TPA: PP2C family protein-serine/threonine phosphatase [Pyrinomonadaceae bacterium]|jgi:sigma-B regulation protein RsbU (phosphoserine phosphatase)
MGRLNFRGMGEGARRWGWRARVWLRRVMPRVAVAAVLLLALRLLFGATPLYGQHVAGRLLGLSTFLVVSLALVYYGARALFWLKRRLLWRVRRRLVITYLFIGLTPIILLGMLGLLAALIGTGQSMSRIVAVQVSTTEREALANARSLADELARLPTATNERAVQSWLDERRALLHPSLPGACVAVWRTPAASGGVSPETLGEGTSAQFASETTDERTRGGGGDTTPVSAPLPEWLRGRAEWSGLAFIPPPEHSRELFASPSVRALVRRTSGGEHRAVLVVVPMSRALVEKFRENAGFNLNLYFLDGRDVDANIGANEVEIQTSRTEAEAAAAASQPGAADPDPQLEAQSNLDQFGEQMTGKRYVVVLPAVNWLDGETDSHISFVLSFTLAEAFRQILGNNELGQVLTRAMLWLAGIFLFLELLALISAAWMTRAVTGTVHKLYRATEYIKRGDFSHRVHVRSHDQLGELAAAFNDMSANIDALLKQRVAFERLEREVEIAAEVQAQLFPRSVPRLPTLEIAGECRAARGVAGDYYDYIEIAEGLVAFALGDVSGKGISASLVMSNLQASLRAQTTIIAERLRLAARTAGAPALASVSASSSGVAGVEASAGEMPCGVTGVDTECAVENMVSSINEQLCRSTDANRFATLFLAIYDDRTRTLRYTNAGHNAPILVRPDGSLERLTEGGTVVGAFDFITYAEERVRLEPGALLVVFSDGISEAQNETGEEYGEERLVRLAVSNRKLSADALRRAVFEEIDLWSGAQERGDDQTVVIVKAKGGGDR